MLGAIRSIKNEILVKVIFILAFSMCTSVAYNYFAGTQLAVASAVKSIEKLNSSALYQTSNFLFEASNITQHGASLLTESISPESYKSIVNYMFSVLKCSPVTSSLSFGLEKGFFVGLDRVSRDFYGIKEKNIPENASFILCVIQGGFDDSKMQVTYYDKDHVEIPFKANKPIFNTKDFRKLSWYNKAFETHKLYFSDIHILKVQNVAGVTTSAPIISKDKQKLGAFSVRITVREFSEFINEMCPTDYSRSFIVNKDRKIIADSDFEELSVRDKENNIKILTTKNLADSTLDMALNQYKAGIKSTDLPENIFYLRANKKDFIVSIDDFPISLGLNWMIVSLTPSSVFTIDALTIQQNSIFLAIAILLGAIVILYFQAQNLSEPIIHLAAEAKKIQSLELDDVMFLNSNIKEIHELTDTMQESKRNLVNFSKYIPKGLVKQFIESQQEVEIGGSTKEVTIMFTDVENFTTLSELLSPQDLMFHLSDYFDNLTGIIIENNGTVDKFIGDAIMAFWGAPTPNSNQAIDACRTALLCQQFLKNINNFWKEKGKVPLVTRIGINFGSAVIGNVGSSERMNYTAIGDSVNLAARLEGINKMYGTSIIISDSAYAQLSSDFIVRPLDIVIVKGKEKHTKIYELVGIKNDEEIYSLPVTHAKFCEDFTIAFDLYLERHWEKAKKAFESLDTLNQKELNYPDKLIPVYIKRCTDNINNPPKKGEIEVTHLIEK